MADKLIEQYHQYYDQLVAWYNSMDFFHQVATLAIVVVSVLLIVSLIHLSKITK